jgi:DNA-binding response OmpR family regulator
MKPRIVIASSDEQLLAELAVFLNNAGFVAWSAVSASQCVDELSRSVPCTLILDLDSEISRDPSENVISAVRRNRLISDVRVIMLTSALKSTNDTPYEIGEHAVMSKPIQQEALARIAWQLAKETLGSRRTLEASIVGARQFESNTVMGMPSECSQGLRPILSRRGEIPAAPAVS